MVEVLTEGKFWQTIATRANLDNWITQPEQGFPPIPFTALIDPTLLNAAAPQPNLQNYFGVTRGACVIVDSKTMAVIDLLVGDPNWGGDPDRAVKCLRDVILPQNGGPLPNPLPPPC